MLTEAELNDIEALCVKKRVILSVLSEDHLQFRARFISNWYPSSKRIYVCGMSRLSKKYGGVTSAIHAATHYPRLQEIKGIREKRLGMTRTMILKINIFRIVKTCFWCGTDLAFASATLEHIIPLVRGGSNGMDNLTLSCYTCNQKHGSGNSFALMKSWHQCVRERTLPSLEPRVIK